MKHLTNVLPAQHESEKDLVVQGFSVGADMPAQPPRTVERLSSAFLEAMAEEDSSDIADRILSRTEQFRSDFAKLLGD